MSRVRICCKPSNMHIATASKNEPFESHGLHKAGAFVMGIYAENNPNGSVGLKPEKTAASFRPLT